MQWLYLDSFTSFTGERFLRINLNIAQIFSGLLLTETHHCLLDHNHYNYQNYDYYNYHNQNSHNHHNNNHHSNNHNHTNHDDVELLLL